MPMVAGRPLPLLMARCCWERVASPCGGYLVASAIRRAIRLSAHVFEQAFPEYPLACAFRFKTPWMPKHPGSAGANLVLSDSLVRVEPAQSQRRKIVPAMASVVSRRIGPVFGSRWPLMHGQ